jgi:acetyl-CoA carboxylase biotin carboxylase subunit
MHRALLELTIEGIETSRDFHLRVMEDEEFRRGEIEIQWLERRLPSLVSVAPPRQLARAAAIAGVLLAEHERDTRVVPRNGARASAPAGAAEATGWLRAARLEGLRDR